MLGLGAELGAHTGEAGSQRKGGSLKGRTHSGKTEAALRGLAQNCTWWTREAVAPGTYWFLRLCLTLFLSLWLSLLCWELS